MRKRHKRSRKVTEVPGSEKLEEGEGALKARERYPWETLNEYNKFLCFLFLGPGRSVRKAYKAYCEANGTSPKKDPPSNWYQLYNGRYAAFRKADRQQKAIERAGEIHNRFPDWEGLRRVAKEEGLLGKYEGDIGEVMDSLVLTDFAFHSLAIDNNGDPLPNILPWVERSAAYWKAVERGDVSPPNDY